MPIFQTNTGYRDPLKAMTIKALEERQAAAAAAAIKAQQVPEAMVDPLQAVGHAFNVMGQGLQQSRIDNAAASQRDALAKLRAGINIDTGANSEQIAQIGAIDPEAARDYYREAMDLRQQAADRAQQTREREAGQTFTAGQNTLTRQQEITLNEDRQLEDRTTATTQYGRDQATAEELAREQEKADLARVQAEKDAAAAKVKTDKDAATEKFGQEVFLQQPTSIASAIQKFNSGGYGDVKDPATKELFNQEIARFAPEKGSGLSLTIDPETGEVSLQQGPGVGGDLGTKNTAAKLKEFSEAATQANEFRPTLQNLRKVYEQDTAGYTGPGGTPLGYVDDALEAVGGFFGHPEAGFLPGSSGPRAMVRQGTLSYLQDAISKTKGAITERENKLFMSMAPGLESTKTGALTIIAMSEAAADRAIQRNEMAQTYLQKNGSLDGFDIEWQKYTDANPLITTDASGNVVFKGKSLGAQQADPNAMPSKAAVAPSAEDALLDKYAPKKR